MKVMHFTAGFVNGGVEQVLLNYTGKLNKDYDVKESIVYLHTADSAKKKMSEQLGNKMYQIPARRESLWGNIKSTYQLIKKEKPDVVHSHMSLMNFFPLTIAKILGVPVRVSHSHLALNDGNSVKDRIYKKLTSWSANELVACGEEAGKYLYGNQKFNILFNAIDQSKYQFNQSAREEIRKKYHIPEKSFLIGNIGRVVEQKNQKFLVEIFDKFYDEYPNSYLMIIGKGEKNQPDEQELEKYIKSKKSAAHIIRVRGVKSTEKFYSAFDVFAMPSLYEGLPVVAIEAQASGIPTILSKNIDPSVIYSDKVKLLSIDEGVNHWINEFQSWKKQDFDRSFRGNDNYNINVQNKKLYDWYYSWINKYK